MHVRRGSTLPGPPLNLQALAGPLPHPQVWNLLVHVRRGSTLPAPGPALNLQALGGQLPHPQCKESPRARTSWLYRRPRGRH